MKMFSNSLTFLLILGTLFATAQGDDDDDDDDNSGIAFLVAGTGYIVLVIILMAFGGIISLFAFLICKCHESATKKRRIQNQELRPGECNRQAPGWSHHLVVRPEFHNQGFAHRSDGMDQMDAYRVVRHRRGDQYTDGARWDVPLTKGKHLFEIIWPWSQRGDHATVGLGTAKVSLKVKGDKSLVGNDKESWGLDIAKRRVYHGGKIFGGRCPPDGSFVPDRFLMFVDMDEGTLGFGVDVTFWGNVVHNLPRNSERPLYVMVGTDKYQSTVSVFYKGSADPSMENFRPPPPANPFAMPPPPGPAREPSLPPAYIEVEPAVPSTSGGSKPHDWTTKPGQAPPPDTALYQEPPPYTAGPPKYYVLTSEYQ